MGPPIHRTDPLAILALQATSRIPELVPIRYGRMAASAFAYFRGAAAVMAADLATEEQTGLEVQLCGDAHLSNFGGFGSPERELIFDVNDFDETIPGPFEWDLKRLAASVEIAARSLEFDDDTRRSIVAGSSCSYRRAMQRVRRNAGPRHLVHPPRRAGPRRPLGRPGQSQADGELPAAVAKAQSKDHLAALAKLTVEADGELRFVAEPPLMMPAESLFTDLYSGQTVANLSDALTQYRQHPVR